VGVNDMDLENFKKPFLHRPYRSEAFVDSSLLIQTEIILKTDRQGV